MTYLRLEAHRSGYNINQIDSTMTAGELAEFFQEFPEDMPVYLSHDEGYTFGGIHEYDFEEWDD